MKLTYAPLWDTLKSKELKKTDLCTLSGLSRNTLAKMGKEEYVALEVQHNQHARAVVKGV